MTKKKEIPLESQPDSVRHDCAELARLRGCDQATAWSKACLMAEILSINPAEGVSFCLEYARTEWPVEQVTSWQL